VVVHIYPWSTLPVYRQPPAGSGSRVSFFGASAMPDRAAFYIDGFNLYHAIADLDQPHLKWLNLWQLCGLLIPQQSQTLARVVWCTAVRTKDAAAMLRHRTLIRAMASTGVIHCEGHFTTEERKCLSCTNSWNAPVEKEGDVNLAISLIDDAYQNLFDHAYLVTADSDQVATAKLFLKRFPGKALTSVAPPGRSHSKEILALGLPKLTINVSQMERCLFPKNVVYDGAVVATRDASYDPPARLAPAKIIIPPRGRQS
jgi:hypothetical protein